MAKSLIEKLEKGVRNTLLLGAAVASIGFAGCKLNNYAPNASLNVNPTSGQAPLTASINLTGNEISGKISEYKVEIDKNEDGTIDETIDQYSPISISRQFSTNTDVYGEVIDASGITSSKVKQVISVSKINPPLDYVDISGKLESDETHTGQQGTIKVFNPADNSLLKTVPTDPYGNFSFTLDELVSQLPNGEILQAETGTEANPTSYVRTITLPTGDQNPITVPTGNPAVRVVPFDSTVGLSGTTYTPSQFISFVNDVNTKYSRGQLEKYNIPNIEIVGTSPLDGSKFSDTDAIKQKAQEWSDIITNNNTIPGRSVNIVVDQTIKEGQISDSSIVPYVNSQDGWEIVIPFNSIPTLLPTQGGTYVSSRGTVGGISGNAVSFIFYNLDKGTLEEIASHEIGLAESYPLESLAFDGSETISNHSVSLSSPSKIDKKYTLLDYEETYSNGESVNNILGTSFNILN